MGAGSVRSGEDGLRPRGESVTILHMFALLTLVALIALVFYWARRLSKKREGASVTPQRTPVDAWIAREVAAIVSKKLSLAKDDVARGFGGDPDPELVSSVERAIAKVELVFEKLAAGETELRAEVCFEDGTSQKVTRSIGWSELPDNVREELARTGASRVHRPWALPWARTW